MSSELKPKGEAMPQTIESWKYLAKSYGTALEIEMSINSDLRAKINRLEQKLIRGKK